MSAVQQCDRGIATIKPIFQNTPIFNPSLTESKLPVNPNQEQGMYTVFIKKKEILESEVKMKPSDSFTVLIRRFIAVLSRKSHTARYLNYLWLVL